MLTNRKIIVVGGSSGIGLAVARKASESGAEVVIASRTAEKLESAAAQLGGRRVRAQVLDATDECSTTAFFRRVGPFDDLVISIKPSLPSDRFLESDMVAVGAAFDTKFWGQYRLAKHATSHIRPGGSITFTSGVASRRTYPGCSAISAMNAAVEALCKSVAAEIAPIRVNCVCPGFVDTEPPSSSRALHVRAMAPNLPLDRLGIAMEIADAYLYLIASPYSTGTVVVVDGGATC